VEQAVVEIIGAEQSKDMDGSKNEESMEKTVVSQGLVFVVPVPFHNPVGQQ
jgi:hypothetical protein